MYTQVDADELIVPYGVGCLPALLRRCSRDFRVQTVATSGGECAAAARCAAATRGARRLLLLVRVGHHATRAATWRARVRLERRLDSGADRFRLAVVVLHASRRAL